YKPDLWVLEIYAETFYKGKTYVSRGGGYSSYWECEEWGDCINGTQERLCVDEMGLLFNRTETKMCFLEFIPLDHKNNEFENILNANQESSSSANSFTGAVIEGASNFV
ncbi:unnamed protein product, partial [marine sediment metagenome]